MLKPTISTELSQLFNALFAPKSIALIGASADERKHTSLPQRYLRKHGFKGMIFPINPSRTEIFGERTYPSIDRVPQRVDHAFIMLPARLVPQAVEECAHNGVRCATIFSAGFAETGVEGRKLQERMVEVARTAGMRILGPNCLGIINSTEKLALSANEVLETPTLGSGRISLLSQSGSLLGSLLSRGQSRGLQFTKMVSVGNEADLSIGEIGNLLVDDPQTEAILLFIETIRDRDRFATFARRAFAAKKPVISYLLGRSSLGNQLAASHTGAIAGNSAAVEAFLAENGVMRVDIFETLIEMAPLVIGRDPPHRSRVNVVATTGGGGALLVDNLSLRNVSVSSPGPAFVEKLAAREIRIEDSLLVDLTIGGTNPKVFGAVLNELLQSPENDAVAAVVGSSSQYRPDRAVMPIIELGARSKKPIAVFLTPSAEKSARLLTDASIAVFRTPEACADAMRAYFTWRAPSSVPAPLDCIPSELTHIAAGNGPVSPKDANLLIDSLGINRVRTIELPVSAADDGTAAALSDLSFPVAVKIISPDIPHKTEVGGVILNVANPSTLREALQRMLKTVSERKPKARIDGFAIQEMKRGLAEVLVGYRLDPQVGPIIVVGAGGVLAEIYRDIAVALAPVTVEGACSLLRKVRGLAPILGYRNLPKGDVSALAKAVSAWSTLAQIPNSEIQEAELNPVIVGCEGEGVFAVDALIVRKERMAL